MSATITPATNGVSTSPTDYVRSLSPNDKQVMFLALLRDALRYNGDTDLLPIEDEEGNPFGYYIPPKAAALRADAVLPKMTPEREAELARRQGEPGRMISEDEFRNWLKQADPARSQ